MSSDDNTPADERSLLKARLNLYKTRSTRRQILDERISRFEREAGKAGAITTEYSELIHELAQQREACDKAALEIIQILNNLSPDSTERLTLELRHLDLKSWRQIQKLLFMSDATVYRYYSRGLDKLLNIQQVRRWIGLDANIPQQADSDEG